MNTATARDLSHKLPPAEYGPAPLPDVVGRAPYPLDALGPLLGGAAAAIAEAVRAPPELAAQSVLAVAGFAAQDKANITMDGRTYPLSLFLITVAESGDRKTACDRVASKRSTGGPDHPGATGRAGSHLSGTNARGLAAFIPAGVAQPSTV